MTTIINNKPNYADNCKFIVARECSGEYWFWGAYDSANQANKAAIEINGVVIHNTTL